MKYLKPLLQSSLHSSDTSEFQTFRLEIDWLAIRPGRSSPSRSSAPPHLLPLPLATITQRRTLSGGRRRRVKKLKKGSQELLQLNSLPR
jgi:hypothetical protein